MNKISISITMIQRLQTESLTLFYIPRMILVPKSQSLKYCFGGPAWNLSLTHKCMHAQCTYKCTHTQTHACTRTHTPVAHLFLASRYDQIGRCLTRWPYGKDMYGWNRNIRLIIWVTSTLYLLQLGILKIQLAYWSLSQIILSFLPAQPLTA